MVFVSVTALKSSAKTGNVLVLLDEEVVL